MTNYQRLKVTKIAKLKKFVKSFEFLMIKSLFKIVLLIILIGFISISPKTRYIFGLSLKHISSFLLWTVKYEDREKWIMDKPSWIPTRILNNNIK